MNSSMRLGSMYTHIEKHQKKKGKTLSGAIRKAAASTNLNTRDPQRRQCCLAAWKPPACEYLKSQ